MEEEELTLKELNLRYHYLHGMVQGVSSRVDGINTATRRLQDDVEKFKIIADIAECTLIILGIFYSLDTLIPKKKKEVEADG